MALLPSANRAANPDRTRMRRVRGALFVLPALLLATSCSLLNGSSGSSGSSTANSQGLEKTTLAVSVMQIGDTAPFYLAMKNGYFAQEGLNIKIVPVTTGAQSIPKLNAGSVDIGFGNWATLLEAQAQHSNDYKIVADGAVGQAGVTTVNVLPSSGIASPADLVGKTVSVNAFSDLPFLAVKAILSADNVDVTKIHFIQVPHPQTTQALSTNQVQAAVQVEPFLTQAEQSLGARPLLDLYGPGPAQGLSIAGYFTTSKFAAANPKTIAAFARALMKGAQDAQTRSNVEQIVPTYATGVNKATASLMHLPTYPTSLNAQRLQRVADLMVQYKLLNDTMDVSKMIVASSTS